MAMVPLLLLALVPGLVHLASSATASNASEWSIGIYGPITSQTHQFLAAAVAFDLDFRKHFEQKIADRFGPPLVQIGDVHPLLQHIGVVIGTSHSTPEIGAKTALDWWLNGRDQPPQVMAVVGGLKSSVATRVASLHASFEVPQVAWGATSPVLSDKSQYPYFLRTIAPDTIQGRAMWVWMKYFDIQSATVVYAEEPYGQGLLKSVQEAADAQAHRIKSVGLPPMPNADDYDVEIATAALHGVKESGSKFILMALGSFEALSGLHILEQIGLLGGEGGYQVLGAESVFPLDDGPLRPSRGAVLGLLKLYPVAAGPMWPRFEELWTNLTPSDLYGEEARERYGLDDMQVSLESGWATMLTSADFTSLSSSEPGAHMFSAFLFDAAYTVVVAINTLLNKGHSLANISSNKAALLEQMKVTVFDGVTGRVSFDENGDRDGQFHLWNLQSNNSGGVRWEVVGLYNTASSSLTSMKETVWATGETSATVPELLLSCPLGFQRDSSTNVCERCRPGVGCGYQAEDGFPIGIFGPITSTSNEILALAVLFDMDLRKNRDPELQARFGPPIVHVPNLHPDLKIKTQIGTSHAQVSTGVETALDWATGAGDIYKVAGIVGGQLSAITRPVASTVAVFEVPQVGWGASNPSLSDKTLYPWFSRVNPPDTLQSQALWAWMEHFVVPSVAFTYARDPYGEGIFQATLAIATSAGQAGRIIGVGVRFQTSADYSLDDDLESCQTIQLTGSKFIALAIPDRNHLTSFLYAMETLGMLYGPKAYQIIGFEGLIIIAGNQYLPSMGFPLGAQRLQQATKGRLFPDLMEMWQKMTPDDIYGLEATRRYMLNYFKVLLADSPAPRVTDATFMQEPTFFYLFLVDAAYTFVFAINSLLNRGISPEEIYGKKLLDEVRNTTFEGVTGIVSFNEYADRHTDSEIWNIQEGQTEFRNAALWKAGSLSYTFTSGNATLTWARGIVSDHAPEDLTACPSGQYWDEGARLCLACERNTYSIQRSGEKVTRCSPCDPGWTSITPSGALGCQKCPNGTSRINEEDCVPCPSGSFGAAEGQSSCTECEVGTYSSSPGLTICEACTTGNGASNLLKTMGSVEVDGTIEYFYLSGATKAEDCGCDRGARRDGNNDCVYCTEGMVCRGMNSVEVAKGYFAGPIIHGGLSIFKCFGDEQRCPGGLPGQTCAEGREGTTCSECIDGKTPSDDGTCGDCGGTDHGAFIGIVLLAIAMLVFMYYVVDTQNRAKGSHALVLAGTSVGMLMTTIQLLAVLSTLPLEYKDPLKSAMDSFSFDLEVVRMNCVKKYDPLMRYIIKVSLIVVVVCSLTALHFVVVLFIRRRASGWRLHSLVAGIGALFMVFYITVTSTVLEPLQCQKHPNTRWTILSYPSVICWEGGDHQTMLLIGVVAFVLVPLSYMVACILAVKQFPSRMSAGDAAFLKAFSFLFTRFKAQQYTFVLKQMMRSFAVAMVLVIPNVVVQIFVLEVVLLVSFASSLAHQPWRVKEANILDCLQGAFSVLVVCLASLFLVEDEDDLSAMASIAFVFVIASLSFSVVGATYGLFRKYVSRVKPYQFFLCHHKAGAGAYTRLLKMQLLEHPKLLSGVFLDSDNLDNLDCLYDYVGNSTAMLVVVCSAEIFSRPWCLGEMCTARLHQVTLCRIGLPSSRLPDDEFINSLAVRLEGIEALTENGIEVDMVQSTLHWIQDSPLFEVPENADLDIVAVAADRLYAREWRDVPKDAGATGKSSRLLEAKTGQCPLIYDQTNFEAEATANILKKLLIPLVAHRSQLVPEPWKLPAMPGNVTAIVVLCSNGLFGDEKVLHLINWPHHASLLPVVAEPGFRFPGKDFANELQKHQPSLDEHEVMAIASFVRNLFKEIAVTFAAQHAGEAELSLASRSVSERLLHAGLKGSKPLNSGSTSSIRNGFSSTSSTGLQGPLQRVSTNGASAQVAIVEEAIKHVHSNGEVQASTDGEANEELDNNGGAAAILTDEDVVVAVSTLDSDPPEIVQV